MGRATIVQQPYFDTIPMSLFDPPRSPKNDMNITARYLRVASIPHTPSAHHRAGASFPPSKSATTAIMLKDKENQCQAMQRE